MVAPRALVFQPLIKGNEDPGKEIGKSLAKSKLRLRQHHLFCLHMSPGEERMLGNHVAPDRF